MSERDPMARIASELSPEARRCSLSLYVAIGDSFTAGTGCIAGQAWPERLATGLRAHHPGLELRNLAVEGAPSDAVEAQVAEALELEPDLVTLVCGANDVLLSPRPIAARYARRLSGMLGRLRGANPALRLVTATMPERWGFLGLRPRTSARVARGATQFNRATRTVASIHAVPCLDVAGHPGLADADNFSEDGLHPSPLGHRRAAAGFGRLIEESFGVEIELEGADHGS
jgi:phosphatidylinositol alpha 1,6-mannosyltransferase